ncbi:hypothetical protein QBC46DRAFT_326314 [Diplogelasinospora grovesii]|uniref:Uncharacterized protein n=1 Tax=Diplogelasinospora grovesii TaxID=303347 RepID=A0AAN6MV19_9PEZI|nr:hypothetical protein QBC46DRAFT_326314 [Diplogelasinospora grovesii]
MPFFSKQPKLNLYVALYAREQPNTYHWALLTGYKDEHKKPEGYRYHVRNLPGRDQSGRAVVTWQYEERDLTNVRFTTQLLVRIRVSKVADLARLQEILRQVPVVQGDPSWTCRIWVRDAIAALNADGRALKKPVNWPAVEARGPQYVQEKIAANRWGAGADLSTAPTWDMMKNKEMSP